MKPFHDAKLHARFWAKVNKNTESGCWEWTAYLHHGYGVINVDNTPRYAHRLVLELYHGPLGPLFACHHCDNRKCVNPDHLFAGTNLDNMQDMVKKGRSRRGEKMHNAVLTEADVITIRERYAKGGYSLNDIARDYGVGDAHAYGVISGRFWSHIPGAIGKESRPDNVLRGSEANGAKLTDDKVRDILSRLRSGETRKSIGLLYGVTDKLVGMIDRGKIWKHIERVQR